MLKTLFELVSSVKVLDKWLERVFLSYRKWRDENLKREIDESVDQAAKKGSISELRKRNRANK